MRSVGAALVKLIVTATSGLVSFTTNVIRPVKVTCEFSPMQEGTGDPSPDNVRPISGWTGANITRAAKNIFGGSAFKDALLATNSTAVADGNDVTFKANAGLDTPLFSKFKPNTQYTLIMRASRATSSNNTNLRFEYTDGTHGIFVLPNDHGAEVTVVFTTAEGKSVKSFGNAAQVYQNMTVYTDRCGIFEGVVTADDFVAYTDTTLPINWQTEAGTVYGGTVTLNEDGSADVVATHGFITYDGSESWQAGTLKKSVYGSYIRNTKTASIWGDSPIVAWSNMAIQGNGAYTQSSANKICATGNWLFYSVDSSVATNVDELKTFLSSNNLQVAYPLRTTTSYHFANIGQLYTFLGTNNIWHDMNGSITAEYYKKQ